MKQAVGTKVCSRLISRPDKTFSIAILGGHMCNIMNKKYSTENNFISAIDLIKQTTVIGLSYFKHNKVRYKQQHWVLETVFDEL